MRIQLPNNWHPRDYQRPAWDYLENGGKHAELIWHRRSGKDDIGLNRAAVAAHERVANYWHMLPLATQVRKAIWEAVNPHTGKKRIDEAFPLELRASTREQEMMIKFKNGSTWQALGSDNYQGAIGSAPAGIVYSEWAISNPSSRGFLRPILAENNGWQLYITTPRGKNHAHRTYKAAKKTKGSFAQILTADDTDVFSAEQLVIELTEYIDTYGEDMGTALFQQEYYCSFDAAILGAIWGAELSKLEKDGRYYEFDHDPNYSVFAALDIGRKDATAIWFYQIISNQIRCIDYYANNLRDVDHFISEMTGVSTEIDIVQGELVITRNGKHEGAEHRAKYKYEKVFLPHDAKAKKFGSKKTVEEQFKACFGWGKVRVLPVMGINDGIKYVRQALRKTYISERCEDGFEALKAYQYEWNEKKSKFSDTPLHNWASDPADAFRYLATAWTEYPASKDIDPIKSQDDYGGYDEDESDDWKTA